ncbi:formylglycine-generating enzyme family protein [Colwellia sp. MSW7]|uniref:Formylglycine-generating enzyme family protein n=1 Tax=Colwellia maritima TaxID=2912588 RepID=A0ABS9WWZ2_9GAMM|nr:SUMF1/EgtB/PvdO family nonheme iron enzyme [Colwellia maritima]MCI2282443.1 formylglycine-generating enzyme family protein [Colwellia maritima]
MSNFTSKNSNKNHVQASFLVFDDYHFAELKDLSPSSIKLAAKNVSDNSKKHANENRKKLKTTTALNRIASTLGFKGGFSNYNNAYEDEILPFMVKHNLVNRSDLFTFRREGYCVPVTKISPQKISERLFFNGGKIPEKVFTGYNFPFDSTFSDGHFLVNGTGLNKEGYEELKSFGIERKGIVSKVSIDKDLLIVEQCRNVILKDLPSYWKNRSVIDVIIGKYLMDLISGFNLIGDLLVEPSNAGVELQMYTPEGGDCELEIYQATKACELFGNRIRDFAEGWLEVIPFNDNLIFLKGANGEYDFVFKNMRDKPFVFNYREGALKLIDLPTCINDYDYARWYYFNYQGQRELDEHHAEQLHYQSGGTTSNYPDYSLLEAFYVENETYSPKRHVNSASTPVPNEFKAIANTNILVTDLVTIAEFDEFLKANPEYYKYRQESFPGELAEREKTGVDRNNLDNDKGIPVACTWYDAMAYLNWKEKITGLSLRLFKKNEFENVRRKGILLNTNSGKTDKLGFKIGPIRKIDMDVKGTGGHNTFVKFPNKFTWDIMDDGTKFIPLNYFAEWVMEKTCVRSGDLSSFYGDDCFRDNILSTTGAYKSTKIGFRLCYEVDH